MAATTLAVGDVAIIGIKTGQAFSAPATADEIYFVLLAPVGSGTQIHFTDRLWTPTAGSSTLNAGSFSNSGGDGTYTYTAGADLPAGTVIKITAAQLSAASIDLDNLGEGAIYVYQGTVNVPTQFLFALEVGDENNTFNASLVNTGLTAGYSAVSIGHESAGYVGPTTHAESFLWNGHASTLMHSIADATNWHGDSADQGGLNNAEDPEIQDGPWLKHADIELWGGMGAGGLANTNGDSTHSSGNDDYNHTRQYEGLVGGQQVFWFASDMMFDTAEGKFFVVDSDIGGGHNRILQGNIADLLGNPEGVPTLTVLFSDAGTTIASRMDNMDIDLVNNIIYFTRGSQVLKIGYNTANQAGTILFDANAQGAVTATTGNPAGSTNNFFNDMVINFTTGKIYLSSTRVGASAGGDILQKNFLYELSGLTTASGANAFTMNGTSNTGTARLLPFAENDQAYNPSGSTYNPWSSTQDPYAWPQERGTLDGLAIDQVNNILFIGTGETLQDHDGTSATAAIYAGGGIYSYSLAPANAGQGGANAVVVIHQQTANFSGAIPGLIGDIEFDPVGGHIYIVDYAGASNSTTDNHIYRVNAAANSTPIQWTQTTGQEGDASAIVGITLNRAPILTGAAAAGLSVTEASSAPESGETSRVTLFTGISMSDFETTIADEITGAVVRIGEGFTYEATSTAGGHTGTVDYLRINGLTTGTIAGSGIQFTYNQTTGAMVLTGAATAAEYKAAIELVQFSTSGDNVTRDGDAPTRKVYVSVSDGLTMSDEIVATVNVTGINDAPVNTPGAAMNFTEDTTGTVGSLVSPFSVSPVNAITGISIADPDADATSDTFTVTLSVNVGTLTIRTEVPNGLVIGQVAGNGTNTITLTGTQTAINNTLAGTVNNVANGTANALVYTPPANFNGAATLTVVTNDQGNSGNDPGTTGGAASEADTDTKTLNVADVNDAPSVGGDGTEDLPTILEDIPPTHVNARTVALIFGGQFSDPLDVQFNAGTNPTGTTGDTLAGIAVVANGSSGATGQWQWYDGASWQDIGSVSVDAAKTFAASTLIRFNPVLNFNGAAPTLSVRLIESSATAVTNNATVDLNPAPPTTGNGAIYSAGTVTLSQAITAVNDAPVNTVGSAVNTTEDVAGVALTGMSVTDVEATGVVYYLLTVQNGTLTLLDNVAGGLTAGQMAGNGTNAVAVTATISQINATLAAANGLVYKPNANFNGADTLSVYVNDNGQTGQDPNPVTVSPLSVDGTATEEDFDTRTINVAAANDPVTTAAPATLSLDEDQASVAVTGMSISDVDAALAPNGLYQVTLTSTNGTLSLSTLTGLTFTGGDGTADASMTFNGTLADINAALASATYTPTAHYHGSAQIQLQATDSVGNIVATGTGAATNDSDTIAVTIGSVNDPVTTSAPATLSVDEDGTNVAVTGLSIADADAALSPNGVYEVTLAATQGTLSLATLTGLTFTAGDGTGDATMTFSGTLADINAALATAGYSPNANYNGPAQITLSATDTFGGIVASGSGTATTDNDTVAVTVNAVNDEPAGTDDNADATEGTPYAFAATDFSDGFSDAIDNHAFAGVKITTLPSTGTLKLSGVAIAAGDTITLAQLTAGALTFEPASGSAGTSVTFTFQVQDNGGTPGVEFDQTPNTFTLSILAAGVTPVNDTGSTAENATTNIDVIANDLNTDNDSKVTHIAGTAVVPGDTVTLTSGAKVTLNLDGTLSYDPNGAFNTLTASASGGTNTSDTDTFTYTEADGGIGTVVVTINGLVSAGDEIVGGPGDNVFYVDDMDDTVIEQANAGTDTVHTALGSTTVFSQLYTLPANVENLVGTNANGQGVFDNALNNSLSMAGGNDLVVITGGGEDTVSGGGGNDFVYAGTAWSSGDSVDGGAGYDSIGFGGGGTFTFGAAAFSGVEQLSFFGKSLGGGPVTYSVTMRDENVGANQVLLVTAANLAADEGFTFNGSAELDGRFGVLGGAGGDGITGGAGKDFLDGNAGNDIIDGGAGNDRIIGGTGADQLTGGAGKDLFVFESLADSNASDGIDLITDFRNAAGERIDLSLIDANANVVGDQAFTFIGVGTAFTGAGQLRVVQSGNNWFVEGDVNGDGTADLTIQIGNGGAMPWSSADFLL